MWKDIDVTDYKRSMPADKSELSIVATAFFTLTFNLTGRMGSG